MTRLARALGPVGFGLAALLFCLGPLLVGLAVGVLCELLRLGWASGRRLAADVFTEPPGAPRP